MTLEERIASLEEALNALSSEMSTQYFETLEEMMGVVAERCQVLSADPATVRKHTLFHWWPRMKEST